MRFTSFVEATHRPLAMQPSLTSIGFVYLRRTCDSLDSFTAGDRTSASKNGLYHAHGSKGSLSPLPTESCSIDRPQIWSRQSTGTTLALQLANFLREDPSLFAEATTDLGCGNIVLQLGSK